MAQVSLKFYKEMINLLSLHFIYFMLYCCKLIKRINMAKVKVAKGTTLINMRIPNEILAEFDELVEADPVIPSRTAKVVYMMYEEIKKGKRAKKT